MSVKNEILNILETNKGKTISGQELADILDVSRTAVWKAINLLKQDGYIIDASSNKGYSLSISSDVVSEESIRMFLNEEFKEIPISVYKLLPSTNTKAKEEAISNAVHGTVIFSDEQTSGRGRFGREFFSPADSGIYMSVILKPNLNVSSSVLVTTAAAVGVLKALDKFTDEKAQIKWVNDIFMNGKKVCGILTEAVTDFESGTVESIIVGIGLNVKTKKEDFPDELKDIAGSLFLKDAGTSIRSQLAAEIINNILSISKDLENKEFLKIYKSRSLILGKQISYTKNNKIEEGCAHDIDEFGRLVILKKDGKIEQLSSGEVSIKNIVTGEII
ncbi:MAG: biotin-protein ligase [Sedimentibacter sp.]|jgi:BirA family biotin operon repressor/biotin-[acetyl-CoA-carboxylase] ligase|nr:biotin-protein ligase [Sedimentibacter sp.]